MKMTSVGQGGTPVEQEKGRVCGARKTMGSLLADRNRLPGNDPGDYQPVRGGALQTFFKAQPSQCIDLCECFNRLLIRRSLMGDITPNLQAKYKYCYVNSAL